MTHRDDSEMSRFERHGQRSYSARRCRRREVALVALLLVLFEAARSATRRAQIDPGIGRDLVEAVGEPTEWVATGFRSTSAQHELTGGLSPDTELVGAPASTRPRPRRRRGPRCRS